MSTPSSCSPGHSAARAPRALARPRADDRVRHRRARLVGPLRPRADGQPGPPDRTPPSGCTWSSRASSAAASTPRASPTTWCSTTPAGSCPSTPSPDGDEQPPYAVGLLRMGGGPGLPLGGPRVPDRRRGRADPAHRLPAPPAHGRVPGLVLRHPGGRRPAEPRDRPPLRRRRRHLARRSVGARRSCSTTATTIIVDHVVLTSGHTYNDEAGRRSRRRALPAALSGRVLRRARSPRARRSPSPAWGWSASTC